MEKDGKHMEKHRKYAYTKDRGVMLCLALSRCACAASLSSAFISASNPTPHISSILHISINPSYIALSLNLYKSITPCLACNALIVLEFSYIDLGN